MNLSEVKEFFVTLPGGQIAVKAWGKETGIPVLALHGWQDNLGTFDKLVPLLSSDFYVVCFDNLGHGLSSHKPPGVFYNYIDMLIEIRRVVNYLKWNYFTIMGHSLGGTLALLYGSLYPDEVASVISLDMIKPNSRQLKDIPVSTKHTILEMIRLESKLSNDPPVYSIEEAKIRLLRAVPDLTSDDAVTALLKRGTKVVPSGNGVIFTRDIRTKTIEGIQLFSHNTLKIYMSNLTCNLLIIVGTNSNVYKFRSPEVLDDFIEIYKKNCKSLHIVKVEGNHFVHLNNPEIVAPHINLFLKKYDQRKSSL